MRKSGPALLRLAVHASAALLMMVAGRLARAQEVADPFGDGPPLRIRIAIDEPEVRRLEADPRSYVLAEIRDGSRVHRRIGVSLKGSAGSFRSLGDKPGLTVKMNQFVPGGRFHGLRKFHLNNAVQDPTYLCEFVGNALFRAAGVPAPRIGFARVELNGRDHGLYVLVEGVTRDLLERDLGRPFGHLYEGPGDITGEMDADSRSIFPDERDLNLLREAAGERDREARWRRLGEALDRERFLSFVALEVLLGHWDGYALGVNNYRLYHDPGTGSFVFLPWGTDQLFQQADAPILPDMQGHLARAVIETPRGRKLYRERLAEILVGIFAEEAIHRLIERGSRRVQAGLAPLDDEAAREHAGAVKDLIERIAARRENVLRQVLDRE